MAKPNYSYEKRQRELAKKKKQEEKRQRKAAHKTEGAAAGDAAPDAPQDLAGTAESDTPAA